MSDDLTPKNYRATGTMAEDQTAYVLLEPLRDDPRLPQTALRLGPEVGLKKAEELAERFNSGAMFHVNPEQVLTGDQIPALHFYKP